MSVEMVYAAFCDECEEDFEECFDSHWTSRGDLEAKLRRSNWKFCDGALLCPDCHAAEAMNEAEDDDGEGEEGDDIEDDPAAQ
jgi:hypothetical protein